MGFVFIEEFLLHEAGLRPDPQGFRVKWQVVINVQNVMTVSFCNKAAFRNKLTQRF